MSELHDARKVPFTLRKRKEIQNLSKAFTEQIPSTISISLGNMNMNSRNELNFFQDSILDIVVFCLSRAVREYPKINARYCDDRSYFEFQESHIGIAFDNGSNLKVLTVQSAQSKSLIQIQNEIIYLLDLYESNSTIKPEFFNHTLTVTDLSGMDLTFVVPTLTSGQSLIIGIAGNLDHGHTITVTYDHRIMEGRYVLEFLASLKQQILKLIKSEFSFMKEISCSVCQITFTEEKNIDVRNRGFIVFKNAKDSEILMCRSCFDGW